MSIFRAEHTTGFTVMSNYHLRNMNLSLKAKGRLSFRLTEPYSDERRRRASEYAKNKGLKGIISYNPRF